MSTPSIAEALASLEHVLPALPQAFKDWLEGHKAAGVPQVDPTVPPADDLKGQEEVQGT